MSPLPGSWPISLSSSERQEGSASGGFQLNHSAHCAAPEIGAGNNNLAAVFYEIPLETRSQDCQLCVRRSAEGPSPTSGGCVCLAGLRTSRAGLILSAFYKSLVSPASGFIVPAAEWDVNAGLFCRGTSLWNPSAIIVGAALASQT